MKDKVMRLFTRTYNLWRHDHAPRIAAALTYYLLLSATPMLVVLVGIVGRYLGQSEAIGQLRDQANTLAGPLGQEVVSALIEAASPAASNALPLIAGTVAVFGALRVFRELRDAFDTIWDIDPPPPIEGTWWEMARSWLLMQVKSNLVAFAMLALVGTLFAASFLASNVLSFTADRLAPVLRVSPTLLRLGESLVSVMLVTLLFAMVYRFLPRTVIGWKDVSVGAAVSAALFVAGRVLLGLYFTHAAPGSAYGAAGSLMAFLIWLNYSVQLALVGAYFTYAWTYLFGSRAQQRSPREQEADHPTEAASTTQAHKA